LSDFDGIERELESLQRTLYDINRQLEYQTRIIESALERMIRSLERLANK